MNNVYRILSGGGILLLGFLMMIFTSTHTVNFIQLSIPGDNQITAYAALAAFDVGMIAWLYALLFNATADTQKAVSGVMVFVSMAGMLAAYAADTFLVAGKKGVAAKLDQRTIDVVLWITVIVVSLNVGAAILYHILDPDGKSRAEIARTQAMLRRRQQEADAHLKLREAEIQIKMKEAELRHIDDNADLIGEERARARAAAWAQKIRRQTEEELPQLPETRRSGAGVEVVDAEKVQELPVSSSKGEVLPAPGGGRTVAVKSPVKKVAVQPLVTVKREVTPKADMGSSFLSDSMKAATTAQAKQVVTAETSLQEQPVGRVVKVQGQVMPALKSRVDKSKGVSRAK